jgi:hypothetical protein
VINALEINPYLGIASICGLIPGMPVAAWLLHREYHLRKRGFRKLNHLTNGR